MKLAVFLFEAGVYGNDNNFAGAIAYEAIIARSTNALANEH
jgi:hypothetical protein